jgi:ribonuclease HI
VSTNKPSRGEVARIATAISGLRPEQKQQLFDLLVERGDLPQQVAGHGPASMQLGLVPEAPEGPWSPDYVLVFDGGSKGNPGLGYGSYEITRVLDGARRLEKLSFGDGYTNNEAEYDTLAAALEDLLARIDQAGRNADEFRLEVRGDSALVINQLQGRWKAKEPRMRERRDRCRRLLSRLGTVQLIAQPREESVRILGH